MEISKNGKKNFWKNTMENNKKIILKKKEDYNEKDNKFEK